MTDTEQNQDKTPADTEGAETPEIFKPEPPPTFASFSELDLQAPLKAAVAELGWTKPTPIQGLCLPLTTVGRDVAGFAQTGTGKTGVFLITIAEQILKAREEGKKLPQPYAIILGPTRELAMQIEADAEPLLKPLGISSMAVFGGIDYDKQATELRSGIDVVVATPGRLKDYCKKKAIDLNTVQVFVCDEADRMLDMGFVEDVEYFLERVNEDAQKLLFSATTNETVKELAFEYLEKPEYISANPEDITPKNIDQSAIMCRADQKLRVLFGLFEREKPVRSIVFTNTKLVAEWLHYKFNGNGYQADMITGDLPQRKRIQLIKKIKNNEIKALIATDVASRGLHIAGVTHVFNFDLPDDAANYVHRIGRTARAGARGKALSLVCDDYGQNLDEINELLGTSLKPDCEWFDEEYLKFEDKSGDWAAERVAKAKEQANAAKSDGRGRPERGGRDTGRNQDRKGASSNQTGRGDNKGRKGPDKNRNRDRNKPQHGNKPHGKKPQVAAKAPEQPKGALQLVKKIFGTIFGKRK